MPKDWQKRLAELDAIEKKLKSELDAARERYEISAIELQKAGAYARELGLGTADGSHALHQASRDYQVAVSRYKNALTRFCNLVIRGEIPKD